MPFRRSPKSSAVCAKRDSFERFDGFRIASPRMALNCGLPERCLLERLAQIAVVVSIVVLALLLRRHRTTTFFSLDGRLRPECNRI